MTSQQIAKIAKDYEVQGIVYTYNEPSIFIEFGKECRNEYNKNGLVKILVSNGMIHPS